MKKPVINQETCIGCSTCSSLASKTFVLGDDGKAKVTNPPGNSQEEIQNAIDSCPVDAISWAEGENSGETAVPQIKSQEQGAQNEQ